MLFTVVLLKIMWLMILQIDHDVFGGGVEHVTTSIVVVFGDVTDGVGDATGHGHDDIIAAEDVVGRLEM